jgi:HAE1 family hydrophobic/amphiphilic exporter-1
MLERFFNAITDASIRFKWLTIALAVILIVAGAGAVGQLKQELIPSIEFPQTILLAFNSEMDSATLLDEVTLPIEAALGDVEGVVNVESTTSDGVAFIIARNEFGLDQEALRAEISAAIAELDYPEGMEVPELLTFSFADLPIATLSVSSQGLSLDELKALVASDVIPQLEGVNEVASVQIAGGQILPDSMLSVEEESVDEEPEAEVSAGIPLPQNWIDIASSQGASISTTDDLTAAMVAGALSLAPELLNDLTAEMILAAPAEVIEAIPADVIATLDADKQAAFASRAAEPQALPLPSSWIAAASAQGVTIETTADLSPEFIGAIAGFAPEMLEELSDEMILSLSNESLAALPVEFLAGLSPEVQAQLLERIGSVDTASDGSGELPAAWQAAGQAQGIPLVNPEDVSPQIMQGIASIAPQLLDMLSPEHLVRFSPETLAWLPADYIQSMDAGLQAELNTLAQPAGGLGAQALAAAEAAADQAGDAPALSGAWVEAPAEGAPPGPSFDTAADLLNNPFAANASELLNLLVDGPQPNAPQLMASLTPDVIAWLEQNEAGFLSNLGPAALRLLSQEVLGSLDESFLSSLDAALRTELEAIAAGTATAFVPTDTINRTDGNPSLILSVLKDGEANTVSVSHEVFAKLDEISAANPDLEFNVVFEQASFIEESISGVTREGGLGALFAVIVILIFLSGYVNGKYKLSWRSTLVTATSIPLSIFMAFALLRWLPPLASILFDPLVAATSSIPVLGDLLFAVSRLFPVDLTLNIMTLSGMTVAIGRVVDDSIVVLENVYRNIQRGDELKEAVLAGTRDVSIAIFASTVTTVVVFLPIGLLGGLVGQFFLPFGVAVTYALLSSFVVAITLVPLLAFMFIRKEHLPEERESALQRAYTPILEWSLKNRALSLGIAGVLLAGSMYLMGQRPQAFIPEFGEEQISVNIDLPSGTTMGETLNQVIDLEEAISDIDGLGVVQTTIGSAGGLQSLLLGESISQSAASAAIGIEDASRTDELTALVRAESVELFGPEDAIVSSGTSSGGAFGGFALILSGDPEDLSAINADVIAALNGIDGLANVSSNLEDADAYLRVDGESAVRYTGELETADTLGVTEVAKEVVADVVPAGITVSEGFETKQQTEGFAQAIQAIAVSVVIVYLVMVITFQSFIHPFTILFSLPMAIIGAAVALWITDRVLGLSVLIGLMMLVGIVVTNAIVLIYRVQANRKDRGMNAHDALMEGGRTRLRPILMTAIAAILALIPLGLGLTEGAIIAAELATVVIGGLFSSTLLTLLIVPVIYSFLERDKSASK